MDNIIEHFAKRSQKYEKYCGWIRNDDSLDSIGLCIPYNQLRGMKVLDLGAGTGAVSEYILQKYESDMELIALDISSSMLEHIHNPNIKKCLANAVEIPFEDSYFDLIVSRQCLHFVENINVAANEIYRVMKPGGIFVISQIVPIEMKNKDYWVKFISFRQPLRKNFFSESEWIDLFESYGLKCVNVKRFSHIGSANRWINQYGIEENDLIERYKELLLGAPDDFKKDYNIRIVEDDIQNTAFWATIAFEK